MKRTHIIALAGLLCTTAAPALAQSAAPPAGSTVPETAPPATNLDQQPGSLSRKLGETKGVIAPSGDVDPAMRLAAPKTGSMPVVKPGQTGQGVAK